jgi:hypothetical protein
VFGVFGGVAVYYAARNYIGSFKLCVLIPVTYLCVSATGVWLHPYRKEIFGKLLKHV